MRSPLKLAPDSAAGNGHSGKPANGRFHAPALSIHKVIGMGIGVITICGVLLGGHARFLAVEETNRAQDVRIVHNANTFQERVSHLDLEIKRRHDEQERHLAHLDARIEQSDRSQNELARKMDVTIAILERIERRVGGN